LIAALLLTLVCLLIAVTEAKVFERCELARTLNLQALHGYRGYTLGNWVCMAYHESSYNTRALGPPNSDGSRDYGIFQINSRWCNDEQNLTGNAILLSPPSSHLLSFLNDDIEDDIVCAKRIVREPQGMNSWKAWRRNCNGKDLSPYTRGCGI
uniref:Lysozyme n=1 Tax=Salvator merianae TaxID=96440 RepID=A0A8D0DZN7_SALMN